jgi:hypothetical protein
MCESKLVPMRRLELWTELYSYEMLWKSRVIVMRYYCCKGQEAEKCRTGVQQYNTKLIANVCLHAKKNKLAFMSTDLKRAITQLLIYSRLTSQLHWILQVVWGIFNINDVSRKIVFGDHFFHLTQIWRKKTYWVYVRFQALTAASIKMTVFWVVPCSLVEVYRRFRYACCLHHQGDE